MPDNRLFSPSGLVGLAGILAVGTVVAAGLFSRRAQEQDLQGLSTALAMPTVKVVQPQAVPAAALELPARVEAWSRAPIHARVGGYLKRWTVDIGAPVKAGQVLGEIETPELDQQLAQARSELSTARSNEALAASTAQRWQSLLASDSVSRQEVDEKAADLAAKQSVVKALQANVDRVQATKAYATLVSPFEGVVTARNTDVGALVTPGGTPGQELFVVSDLRRLRVYVNVPQRLVPTVRVNDEAELRVPERPGKVYHARVDSLSQAIQPGSGGMLVQLRVDNLAGDLLPGSFALLRFSKVLEPSRVGVPPGALIYGKEGVRVAVLLANGRVHLKTVTIARDLGALVELREGPSADERLIDSPPDGLAEGDIVRVAPVSGKGAT